MKTRVCLRHLVHDYIWKQFFASNFPKVSLNLIWLTIVVTLRPLTQIQPKTRATNLQKSAKTCLTW